MRAGGEKVGRRMREKEEEDGAAGNYSLLGLRVTPQYEHNTSHWAGMAVLQ